jgi:hypothetical protein
MAGREGGGASDAQERVARRVIRIAGTATLVLGVTLLAVLPAKPVVENVPGFATAVVGFELASTPAHVFGILGAPGTPERTRAVRHMMLGTWIDFLFALAYATLYAGIALFLGARGRMPRPLLLVVAALAATMAVADGLENGELLLLCGFPDPAAMSASLARLRMFTLTKWYAIYAASALLLPFLWRAEGRWRWAAPAFAAAAAIGAASVVHLPAIEHSSLLLSVAWTISYWGSFERPLRDPPG